MAKYSYKEIKEIIADTPPAYAGKSTTQLPAYNLVGYFHPKGTNWSYQVIAVNGMHAPLLLVLVFGHVEYNKNTKGE